MISHQSRIRFSLMILIAFLWTLAIPATIATEIEYYPAKDNTKQQIEANYRWSFGDEQTFVYGLFVRSNSGEPSIVTIPLRNHERVTQVLDVDGWSVEDGQLILRLSGDYAHPDISGRFHGQDIQTPLAAPGTALFETKEGNHLFVNTTAKPIPTSDSKVTPSMPVSTAFQTQGDELFMVISGEEPELPSLVAVVNSATQTYAVTEEGSVIGELQYNYDNSGLGKLTLPKIGTPLYIANSNGPTTMKMGQTGNDLKVELPQGKGLGLDYVFLTSRTPLGIFDKIDLPSVKTDLPISTMTTRIMIPDGWFVIDTLGARGGSELPPIRTILVAAILIGILAYALKRKPDFMACYIVLAMLILTLSKTLFYALIAGSIIMLIQRHYQIDMKKTAVAIGGVIVCVLLLNVFIDLKNMTGELGSYSIGAKTGANAVIQSRAADVLEKDGPLMALFERIASPEAEESQLPTKLGAIPVKFQLPAMGKTITVTNKIVTKESHPDISLLVVSSIMIYPLYLLALFCGWHCWKSYGQQDPPIARSPPKAVLSFNKKKTKP